VLLSAIDAVATGESQVPMPGADAVEAASSRLLSEDLPILGMLLARMRVAEIAARLGLEPRDVRSRGAAHHRGDAGAGPPPGSCGGLTPPGDLLTTLRPSPPTS
jgi:hypothetical protein